MNGMEAHRSATLIMRFTRWRGEKRVAKALAALFVVCVVGMLVAPWRQNAVGFGEVVAFSPNERQLDIQAPIEGRVEEWFFVEGDHVEDGEVIVRLADNDPNVLERYRRQLQSARERVDAAQRSVEVRRDRIETLERGREQRLQAADARIEASENAVDVEAMDLEAAEARRRATQIQRERVVRLAADGLASQREREVARRNDEQAEAAYRSAVAALEAARAELAAKRTERHSTEAELTANIASAEDSLASAVGSLADARGDVAAARRALARQSSLEIRAPRSGMLTHVIAREDSAYVTQGEVIARVVPDTVQRAVELYVSGNDGPLVVTGQPVRLQFEGWPAIQLGGWPEAAVGTFQGRVAFVDARATDDGRFRVLVRPAHDADWPRPAVLRQGNEVSGWVLLDEVPLAYELWRQLNAFPPNLPPRAAEASGYE
jgi:membrane fusion protein, adhesin transport system